MSDGDGAGARTGKALAWLGGAAVAGAAAATAAVLARPADAPPIADPAKIFTRADAADLFAQSSQGAISVERSLAGTYPGQWTATGGAQIDYAFQIDGDAARSEVTQAGFLQARRLDNGSIAEFGILPAGCRLELVHGGDLVSVNDSDVHGDADCWSVMQAVAMKIDSRF